MLKEYLIKDLSGNLYTEEEFTAIVKDYEKNNFNLYVGTDSKIVKKIIILVSVICFHKDGTSGKVFYMRDEVSRKKYPNLRTRMLLEAFKSIELASELDLMFSNSMEIHLDIGDTIRSKTSAYEPELTNLVIGQGYNCKIKPDSWGSSAVADKILRGI